MVFHFKQGLKSLR